MYYAAINSYATDTSVGFCNTWSAIGFATRATRDAYVHCATDMATRAILASELRSYGEKPGHVSHYTADGAFMQHRQYMQRGEFSATGDTIDTTTGRVRSCWEDVTGDVLDAAFPTN